jgi:hypothetical protein
MNSILAIRDQEDGYVPTIAIHSGPKVDQSRNELFRIWLEETTADRLFMVDDDMAFPRDSVKRLRAHNKDLIGGLYFLGGWTAPIRPSISVVREADGDQVQLQTWYNYPVNALSPVEGLGGGFMLISRRCAETVWEARGKDHPLPWFAFGMHHGVEIGEDIAFCLTALKCGFQPWVDTSLEADHMKSMPINSRNYVASLQDSRHPCYNLREEVPIYQELVGNGDSRLNGDRPSVEAIPEEYGPRLVTVGPN